MNDAQPVLEARDVRSGYGSTLVRRGVDLSVGEGQIVVLLGANGAGKTTTLLTIAGILPLVGGHLNFVGAPMRGRLHARARRGLGLVTEECSIFRQLPASVNLRLGRGSAAAAIQLFPELEPLLSRKAGLLSGGEQQMLSLGRALAAKPRLLLVDELSLGLAPLIVERLLIGLRRAATEDGTAILLVEQHARQALRVADRGYVMGQGQIKLAGSADELLARSDEVEQTYLHGAPASAPAPRSTSHG